MASDDSTKRVFDPFKAIAENKLKYDPVALLEDFETKCDASDRNEKLIRRLERYLGLRAYPIVSRLEACSTISRSEPTPCLSPACWICGRAFRRWFVNQAHLLMDLVESTTGHRGVIVTVIAAGLTAEVGKLSEIDLKAARLEWWKLIHRLGMKEPILGGIDVSFNEKASSDEPGHHQVHFAFVVFGHDAEKSERVKLKERIKSVFELEPTADRPVKIRPLVQPVKQLCPSCWETTVRPPPYTSKCLATAFA